MASTLFIVIPYESDISFSSKDVVCCVFNPYLPELKKVVSIYKDSLILHRGFVLVMTNVKGGFTCQKNGFCGDRLEAYKLAKALGADEVWYVIEEVVDEMDIYEFDFDRWRKSLSEEMKDRVVEINVDAIKEKKCAAYYHDNFSDIVTERPVKSVKKQTKIDKKK